jgi:hypothetical protein
MATTAQLNAIATALKGLAFQKIQALVPSFEQGMAEGFVSNALLLEAAQVSAAAYEKAAPPKLDVAAPPKA